MRKVAITGGSGLLGRYVTRAVASNYEVSVLDKSPHPYEDGQHRNVTMDVLDCAKLCEALTGHDYVIHLAGLDVAIEASDHDFFHVNVQGTWNVLHAAERAGVKRVVIASSIAALGLEDLTPQNAPQYLPVDEAHPLSPTHPYGMSKQVMETIARGFVARGQLEVIALRPVLVAFEHLIAPTAELIELRDVHKEVGYLTVSRSYVSPQDTARCFELALLANTEPYDVFFVAAPQSLSPEPTVTGVQRRFGVSPPLRNAAWFDNDPHASMVDTSRAQRVLGWRAKDSWQDLICRWG